jgi:hypothetical protein
MVINRRQARPDLDWDGRGSSSTWRTNGESRKITVALVGFVEGFQHVRCALSHALPGLSLLRINTEICRFVTVLKLGLLVGAWGSFDQIEL